jgi:hypothetical protein
VLEQLTEPVGIVALAAAVLGLAALIVAVVALVRTRGLARAQRVVLGEAGERDLVEHAARLSRGYGELRDWAEDVLTRVDERVGAAEQRLDGCVAYRSLIRYDAYGEMSGRQSSSVALLDQHRSGVVISSILHRDQARVYVKQVHQGTSDLDLSPEELEAIETAVGEAGGR